MTDPESAASQVSETGKDGEGIYLYGIGLASSAADWPELERGLHASGLRVIRHGDVVAFTRSVLLSEFSEVRMQERLQDQEWLMRSVQHHHQVIADLSGQVALLPSTFGAVYESERAVLESLAGQEEPLVEQLQRVAGCDEWALHLFREESGVRERALEADSELRRMSDELESAPPGRAYLLKQQLEKRLKQAVEEQQLAIADSVLDQVQQYTREIQVEDPRSEGRSDSGDVEIAQASLLVPRERSDDMLDVLNAVAESTPGIRVELSGPWPVYSFAGAGQEAN